MSSWRFDTKQIHSGWDSEKESGATSVPIYLSSSFAFDDVNQAAARFSLQDGGPIYSRLTNPTNDVVERRVAALEGGVGALLVSSGQAASTLAILNLAGQGSNVIVSPSLYGGTTALLKNTLARLGIETRFVDDLNNVEQWHALADENTVAFYAETISNPLGAFLEIESISKTAHAVGVPLILDNTVATPYLIRPFEWGADIVVHSGTKYLTGHGTALSGVIVDGGKFNFTDNPERYPFFNDPDPSYHGLKFGESFGSTKTDGPNLSYIVRARAVGLRDLGFALSPFHAFLLEQGIQTLSLRVQRHSDNALAVAKYLETEVSEVVSVHYAGLETSPFRVLQRKYAPHGAGGLITFDLRGGFSAGKAFISALKLHPIVANIGDVKSLAIHPASTTHSQLDETELQASGLSFGSIRLSVGIEYEDDIISDLKAGFEALRAINL